MATGNNGVIAGFRVHKQTIDALDPIKKLVAQKLIADGVWVLDHDTQ